MSERFWFGITVRFTCQHCQKLSFERMVMNNIRPNPEPIMAEVKKQTLMCKNCKLPVVIGTDVEVLVIPGKPELLRQKGFALPLEAFVPPPDEQS